MALSRATTVDSWGTLVRQQRTVSGQYTTTTMRTTVAVTVPAAMAARRNGNSLGRRIQQAAYRTTSGGSSSTAENLVTVSYTHLRAHETVLDLVCRLLLEK